MQPASFEQCASTDRSVRHAIHDVQATPEGERQTEKARRYLAQLTRSFCMA